MGGGGPPGGLGLIPLAVMVRPVSSVKMRPAGDVGVAADAETTLVVEPVMMRAQTAQIPRI